MMLTSQFLLSLLYSKDGEFFNLRLDAKLCKSRVDWLTSQNLFYLSFLFEIVFDLGSICFTCFHLIALS